MNTLDITADSEFNAEADSGLVTSLKIAGMINQQHAVYLHTQSSRFGFDIEGGDSYTGARSTLSGVGYTYYTKPTTGSPFVEASVGLGSLSVDSGNLDLDASGQSFLLGAVYEVNEHFQVGVNANLTNTDNDNVDSESYSVQSYSLKAEFKL